VASAGRADGAGFGSTGAADAGAVERVDSTAKSLARCAVSGAGAIGRVDSAGMSLARCVVSSTIDGANVSTPITMTPTTAAAASGIHQRQACCARA
jgi:hypothetical protein